MKLSTIPKAKAPTLIPHPRLGYDDIRLIGPFWTFEMFDALESSGSDPDLCYCFEIVHKWRGNEYCDPPKPATYTGYEAIITRPRMRCWGKGIN